MLASYRPLQSQKLSFTVWVVPPAKPKESANGSVPKASPELSGPPEQAPRLLYVDAESQAQSLVYTSTR
jgi:hypothetical protein